MKLNDIRVARKLWATLLGLLIAGMAVAGFTLNRSSAAMDKAVADVEFFESMITLALKWQNQSTTNNERALALLMINDEATIKLFEQRMAEASKATTELQEKILAGIHTDPVHKDEGLRLMEGIKAKRAAMLAVRSRSAEVKATGNRETIEHFGLQELEKASKDYMDALNVFVEASERLRDESKAEAARVRAGVTRLGLISAVIAAILVIVIARALVRSITAPLEQAVNVAKAISQGDLTKEVQVNRKDEFGQLLQAQADMSH